MSAIDQAPPSTPQVGLDAPVQHRGPLSTALGKQWAPRRRRAERYYEQNSTDWEELRLLYTAARKVSEGWNSSLGMAWSVLQNLVADSFFQNPEPVILPLTPAREDEARMLTDLGRAWHDSAGTEDNVMRTRILCGLMGGAVIWVEEDADYEDAPALDEETGEQMQHPDTGEPLYELDANGGVLQEATRQEFTQTLIDFHAWRVDPDGRRWDHKDHKWVERRYERSLQSFLDDPTIADESKSMLRTWTKSRRWQKLQWESERDGNETDPNLIMVDCGEIWSMVHGKIIHMPVEAEFHLKGSTPETEDGWPMPKFWLKTKKYPAVLFAYNWDPPDRYGRHGYYPIPDLRLVKSQLRNLIRLEGLILNLCTQQTQKFFYPDGMLDNKVQRRVDSDVSRDLIGVDYFGIAKKLSDKGVSVPRLGDMIVALEADQSQALVKHFEAFTHEVDLIRETLSQGSAQRGGVADSHTATGQLQVGQALERRLDIDAERTSSYIDQMTERYFMLLQNRQTLPLYYRDTGTHTQAFRPFVVNQQFRELRMSFSHRTGTARGVNRESLRAQEREAIQNAIPVIQDPVLIKQMLKKLFETFDDPSLADIFGNDLSGLAEQAAELIQAVEMSKVSLDQAGPQLLEYLSAFLNAHISQSGLDQVAQAGVGGPPPVQATGERTTSIAKPKSAGKQAFDQESQLAGQASAGRIGGMGNAG